MTRIPLLILLAGCLNAQAVGVEPAPEVHGCSATHETPRDRLLRNHASIEAVHREVGMWGNLAVVESEPAAAAMMVNCPYNRAAFQLPIALDRVASRHAGAELDAAARADWEVVRSGLALHVETVDQLSGGALHLPKKGDYLTRLPPGVAIDRATLDASDDPLAQTLALVDTVNELVEGYDEATLAKLEAARPVLRVHTGDTWSLKPQLDGWQTALEALLPKLSDPEMKRDVAQMIRVLDAYGQVGC